MLNFFRELPFSPTNILKREVRRKERETLALFPPEVRSYFTQLHLNESINPLEGSNFYSELGRLVKSLSSFPLGKGPFESLINGLLVTFPWRSWHIADGFIERPGITPDLKFSDYITPVLSSEDDRKSEVSFTQEIFKNLKTGEELTQFNIEHKITREPKQGRRKNTNQERESTYSVYFVRFGQNIWRPLDDLTNAESDMLANNGDPWEFKSGKKITYSGARMGYKVKFRSPIVYN